MSIKLKFKINLPPLSDYDVNAYIWERNFSRQSGISGKYDRWSIVIEQVNQPAETLLKRILNSNIKGIIRVHASLPLLRVTRAARNFEKQRDETNERDHSFGLISPFRCFFSRFYVPHEG